MFDYSPKILERKMKFLSLVMKLYLIIWIITPVLGIYEECNKSLGISELDINKISVNTILQKTWDDRGNIRLSDDWTVFTYEFSGSTPAIRIDLGKIYNITGMIIKGQEGIGTGDMEYFLLIYSNSTDPDSIIFYENEKGEIPELNGTTKEEYIRYQRFYPSFLARYFNMDIGPTRKIHYGAIYLQIDVLGCNITEEIRIITKSPIIETTTVMPCNDILNTTRGPIIYGDAVTHCSNNDHLEIKFEENGIYQITMVNITITDNDIFNDIIYYKDYTIFYIYGSEDEIEAVQRKEVGQSFIFDEIKSSVQSLRLCIYTDKFAYENKNKEIYKYAIIEVRGCRIGSSPAGSSTE